MTRPEVIAIGASLGGLDALVRVLEPLPKDLPVPIAIVQHRRADGDSRLAELLSSRTGIRVVEAEAQAEVAPGKVYLAPSDYHLLIEGDTFELSLDPPVNFARPSIDVLFESLADSGRAAIGVLLTGSSVDGAAGIARLAQRDAITIVQDPADAESPIAPQAALLRMNPTYVLSIAGVGALIAEVERGRQR